MPFARRISLLLAVLAALLGAGIGLGTSFYMGAASFAYFLMVLGMRYRRGNRHLHRRLMFSAMGIDLSLVLLLELQRNATQTVVNLDLSLPQLGHVLASTLAILLYFPMIILGLKLWREESSGRRLWHKRIGIAAFVLRTTGFGLMFSLLGRYP